ncbi:hypothetical protein F511_30684 [Dorcoceras hygrometricum]|uniref:Uncharacterized protein n=1 Tax=Dorcoceras hygrometricum TaxID=472368 RepID=A0A2Z7BK16_9LAMI|nr:hypothetical protein F511_30684 [Dorcoceras hygrometricum]
MKKAAGALSIDDVISSDITTSRKLMFTSRCYLKLAIAKRCRLNKLVRQRFAFALRFSRWFDFSRWIQWNGFSRSAKTRIQQMMLTSSRWNITHVEKKPAGAFIQVCSSHSFANDEGSAGHQKGISGYQQNMNPVAAEADNITERSCCNGINAQDGKNQWEFSQLLVAGLGLYALYRSKSSSGAFRGGRRGDVGH